MTLPQAASGIEKIEEIEAWKNKINDKMNELHKEAFYDKLAQVEGFLSSNKHKYDKRLSRLEYYFAYRWYVDSHIIKSFGFSDLTPNYLHYMKYKIMPKHPILRPQYKYLSYRIDFAIVMKKIKIAIELDGYAYHGRNKESFQNDRTRQNDLIKGGWTILRYTWNDIFENEACFLDDIFTLTGKANKEYIEEQVGHKI